MSNGYLKAQRITALAGGAPKVIVDKSAAFQPNIKLGSIVAVYSVWVGSVCDVGQVIHIIEAEAMPAPKGSYDAMLANSNAKPPVKPSKYKRIFIKRRNGRVALYTLSPNEHLLLPGDFKDER
jgi:hypothetical protein